jgi:2'-5' RNA ligase
VGDLLYALSSDLTGPAAAALTYVWDGLEARFGLRAVKASVAPHVTYVAGRIDAAQRDALMIATAQVAHKTPPFSIDLEGLSSFDGERPVLFVRVVKGGEIERAYDAFWRAATAAGMRVDPLYLPTAWVPHCTLVLGDARPEQVPAIREYLRTVQLVWKAQVRSVELFHVVEPEHERIETWPLRG